MDNKSIIFIEQSDLLVQAKYLPSPEIASPVMESSKTFLNSIVGFYSVLYLYVLIDPSLQPQYTIYKWWSDISLVTWEFAEIEFIKLDFDTLHIFIVLSLDELEHLSFSAKYYTEVIESLCPFKLAISLLQFRSYKSNSLLFLPIKIYLKF